MSLKDIFPYFGKNQEILKPSDKKKIKSANDGGVSGSQIVEKKNKPANLEANNDVPDDPDPDNDEEVLSRRDFLKKGTAATVTAAATYSAAVSGAIKVSKYLSEDRKKPVAPSPKNDISYPEHTKDTSEEDAESAKEDAAEISEKNICDHFTRAYEYLASHKNSQEEKDFWKDDLFTDDFFISIQLTESDYKTDAVSDKNAYGVMQVREIAIKDIIRIHNKLKRNNIYDNYNGPDFKQLDIAKWEEKIKNLKKSEDVNRNEKIEELIKKIQKQKNINKPILDKIVNIIKKDANYNRAIGKTYFMMLFNKDFGYGIGWDEYKKGNIKEAQKQLAMAYNCGPTHFKKNYPDGYFDKETKNYPVTVFDFKKRLENIKTAFKNNGIISNNEANMLLARKMSYAKDNKKRHELILACIDKVAEEQLHNLSANWPTNKHKFKKILSNI